MFPILTININPEQAPAFMLGSRRVDFFIGINYFSDKLGISAKKIKRRRKK
jgi:hypothetical protein